MRDHLHPVGDPDHLDELVDRLLECGGVLSQIISHMVRFEASGHSDPNAVPIPDMAHSLIRSVLDEVRRDHSKRDIRVAAAIVHQATEAIVGDLFLFEPEPNCPPAGQDHLNGRASPPTM
jgi:hypothetical protein